ncbi:MAG: hypothetical protein R6U98_09315, partial [Pirellulaceae bacterium]
DWQAFWTLTAFLSIILAIMNILPIPALKKIIRDRYISGGWMFPDGKPPDASRPPVGRTRGGENHPRPV